VEIRWLLKNGMAFQRLPSTLIHNIIIKSPSRSFKLIVYLPHIVAFPFLNNIYYHICGGTDSPICIVIERYTERDTILLARYHLPPLQLHTFTGLVKNMNSRGEEKETQACSTFKQQAL